jgi:ABC-type lipoprotein export system ATPase subunit
VLRLLEPVMARRTTIIITHDTSIAARADRVVDLGPAVRRARFAQDFA